MKDVRKLGLLAVLLLMVPVAAHADFTLTVGGAGCGSCYGGTYTLTFVGNNTTDSTFKVTLSITTPSDTTSPVFGQYITGVGFGDGKKIASVTPVSTAVGGTWSTKIDNLNSGSTCSGPPPGNKVCSQQNGNVAPFQFAQANGSTYTWTWYVTFATPGLNLNLEDIHIQAQYEDAGGSNGHLVSETGVSVPEPATAAMFGVGLALFAFKLRRRS